jgi:hypothetical protein
VVLDNTFGVLKSAAPSEVRKKHRNRWVWLGRETNKVVIAMEPSEVLKKAP